jgi:MFS family permease
MIARSNDTPISESPERCAVEGAVRSAAWRVIPLLAVGYIVSYIDRANISFAALTMNKDLGLTATQFGFAAGTFYVGYCLFEIPSNVALQRFGSPAGWREMRAGGDERMHAEYSVKIAPAVRAIYQFWLAMRIRERDGGGRKARY